MAPGHVYVMFNSIVPSLVKVGRTANDPDERAEQISAATGMPGKWHVIFYRPFADDVTAERKVHELLDRHAPRQQKRRELFEVAPTVAINCVLEIHARPEMAGGVSPQPKAPEEKGASGDELIADGDNYLYGRNGELEDFDAAVACYQKAKDLGVAKAYERLGQIELLGLGPERKNLDKALEYFRQGEKAGDITCHLWMARTYADKSHPNNAHKCIAKYLAAIDEMPEQNEHLGWFLDFLKREVMTGRINSSVLPKLSAYRDRLLDEQSRRSEPDKIFSALRIRRLVTPREVPDGWTGTYSDHYPVTVFLGALQDLLVEAGSIAAFEEQFGLEFASESARDHFDRSFSIDTFTYPPPFKIRGTMYQFYGAFRLVASKYLRTQSPYHSATELMDAFCHAESELGYCRWNVETENASGTTRYLISHCPETEKARSRW